MNGTVPGASSAVGVGRLSAAPAVDEATSVIPADRAERGRTDISTRVVEKIAAQAAGEVPHVGGLRRRLAGQGVGAALVRCTAEIDGGIVALQLELAVDYGRSIRAVTRAARAHVIAAVQRLCDLRVDHLDITVSLLRRPKGPPGQLQRQRRVS
jgi:uncharacterized alkaline shock family protein YloU